MSIDDKMYFCKFNAIWCFQNLKLWKSDFFKISNLKNIFQISKPLKSQNFQNSKSENKFWKSEIWNIIVVFLSTQFFSQNKIKPIFFVSTQKNIIFRSRYEKYLLSKFRVKFILSTPSPPKPYFVILEGTRLQNQDLWNTILGNKLYPL